MGDYMLFVNLFNTISRFLPREVEKRLRLIARTGLALSIVNFVFQKVFRIDSKYPYSKHYTSRIVYPSRFIIEDWDLATLLSIAVSGGCYFQAGIGIQIGKGTIIAPNVSIVSVGHDIYDFSKVPNDEPIKIGRYCWIGASTVIRPGIELGDHSIVGAGSVVTRSYPEGYVVLGGVPARVIKRLDYDRFTNGNDSSCQSELF
jgi:serine acetyltransferase